MQAERLKVVSDVCLCEGGGVEGHLMQAERLKVEERDIRLCERGGES